MERNAGLDLVRATAIIFVLLSHTGPFYQWSFHTQWLLGVWGVEIFFVLSGYLIGRILIRNLSSNVSIFSFWWRRWLRTIPSYFLFLSANSIVTRTIGSWGLGGWTVIQYMFFYQNLYYPANPTFFIESWSLAVEEWFYLTIPLVLYLTKTSFKRNHQCFLGVIFLLVISSIVIRYYYNAAILPISDFFMWDQQFRKVVLFRMDSLQIGMLGAYLSIFYQHFFNRRKKLVFVTGLCLTILLVQLPFDQFEGSFIPVFYSFFVSLSILFLFPFVMSLNLQGSFKHVMEFISKTSYILYLSHSIIAYLIVHQFSSYIGQNILLDSGLRIFWLTATVLISYLVHRYFEKPIMDLR